MSLFAELKRRNVFRVAIFYAVTTWLLLQVTDVVSPILALPDWLGKVIFYLMAIGFIPALILAWIYELTPEGVQLEKDVERDESITDHTAKKLDLAVIAILVVAIGIYSYGQFGPGSNTVTMESEQVSQAKSDLTPASETDNAPIDAIAVLPFKDFSKDKDQEHLATGIADTILHTLAQIKDLRVAARTSSFLLAEQNADIATVGTKLNVGAVLEGSVQKAGDRLRIIAQLIRVSDQSHLWSETFDRPSGDIFAIQDEIANAVLASLGSMGDEQPQQVSSSHVTSPDVYELYLKGRLLWQERTATATRDAVDYLRQAASLDPDFAPVHSELAMAILFDVSYGGTDFDTVESVIEAEIERARVLDPNDPMVFATTGFLRDRQGDRAAAQSAFERAIELEPDNPNFHSWLAGQLGEGALFEASLAHRRKAVELDPLNIFARGQLANTLVFFGDPEEGLAIARESVAIAPGSHRALTALASTLESVNRDTEAIATYLQAVRLNPQSSGPYNSIAWGLRRMGALELAQRWHDLAASLDPSIDRNINRFYWAGDAMGALALAQELHAEEPDLWQRQLNYGFALMMNGRNQEALKNFERAKELMQTQSVSDQLTYDEYQLMARMAWLRKSLGQEVRANELVEEIRISLEFTIANGLPEVAQADPRATIAILTDDVEETIAQVKFVVDRGYQLGKHLYSPMFSEMRNHPDGIALLESYWALQEEKLARLKETADPILFDPPATAEGFL